MKKKKKKKKRRKKKERRRKNKFKIKKFHYYKQFRLLIKIKEEYIY